MENREQHRQQHFAMITSWQQSGQSQKQYCRQNSIAYHVFHYWYKVYREEHSTAKASFVPLTISQQLPANVEVQFESGSRIVFHQPVSAAYLKTLIA